MSRRVQREVLRCLVHERVLFFVEIMGVMDEFCRQRGREDASISGDGSPAPDPEYCDHCGGCCEIASGYAAFPEQSPLPPRWRRIFADGLGANHRFCPFLLEKRRIRQSLCAVYEWRPLPCRIFEQDECEHLKSDPDFADMGRRRQRWQSPRWISWLLR